MLAIPALSQAMQKIVKLLSLIEAQNCLSLWNIVLSNCFYLLVL